MKSEPPGRWEDAPPCMHSHFTDADLYGGDGPDEAAAVLTCIGCGAYRWRYCDGTYSTWRPKL